MELACQLYTLTILAMRKELLYSLNRRLGGPWSQSGQGGKELNPHHPAHNKSLY
jgi:hypothetical protein